MRGYFESFDFFFGGEFFSFFELMILGGDRLPIHLIVWINFVLLEIVE